MSRSRIAALAAALAAAAALAGGTAAQASMTGYGDGYGATPAAAEQAAVVDLHGNYWGCGQWVLDFDTQLPSGTWWAEVSAGCARVN
jgi:hypothetical protein